MDSDTIADSPNAPAVPRQTLSKEGWEELRPLIQRLYIGENRKFKEIAAVIEEEHGFLLTKRQFDVRVAKWNMKKNATQWQRRAIMQNVGGLTDRYSVELNGMKVSRSKLIRWERELKKDSAQGAGLGVHSPDGNSSLQFVEHSEATSPGTMNGDNDFLPNMRKDPQSISRERQPFLDHHRRPFAFVDVPGSPKLSRLFTALLAHGSPSIDPFSLSESTNVDVLTSGQTTRDILDEETGEYDDQGTSSSNNFVLSSQKQLPKIQAQRSSNTWVQPPSLFYELYPFPEFDKEDSRALVLSETPLSDLQFSIASLQARVAEQVIALPQLEKLHPRNHPKIIESMEILARCYCLLGEHRNAEKFWKRVAEVRQRTDGARALSTLTAWLQVVRAIDDQGDRYEDAEELNKQLFAKILQGFSVEHELALEALRRQGLRQNNRQNFEAAESMYRQLLQLRLTICGPRAPPTIKAMSILARNLSSKDRLGKRKTQEYTYITRLARSAVQLQDRAGIAFGSETSYDVVNDLLFVLRMSNQYDEGIKLGEMVVEKVSASLGQSHPETLRYIGELGAAYRQAGRLSESVAMFKTVISRQRPDINRQDITWRMAELFQGLEGLGRHDEALPWLERYLPLQTNYRGSLHRESKEVHILLADRYMERGRLNDALVLYQNHIALMKAAAGGDNHPYVLDFEQRAEQLVNQISGL